MNTLKQLEDENLRLRVLLISALADVKRLEWLNENRTAVVTVSKLHLREIIDSLRKRRGA